LDICEPLCWQRDSEEQGKAQLAEKMQGFVKLDQEWPERRSAEERLRDFREIYGEFSVKDAAAQASRCAQCGVPFCQAHCPLQNNIPDWLRLAAEGRLQEAYETSAATNPMPEVCGRICPQDRLCEGSCVIEQSEHGSVTIGAIEKYLTELAWREGWVAPVRARAEKRQSVGVIGAGPAGLAAAERLRTRGYQVVVYDRHDRAGGLLAYGIPNFKLEKHVVERRVDRLVEAGVAFALNCNVGETVGFEELRQRHDSVLIATGVYQSKAVSGPSEGVVKALDFLIAANRAGFGEAAASPSLSAQGKRVIVIGGGDTAMDCVRTARRQGAKSVVCLYRRDRANMPGSQREVGNAEEEGVGFDWLTAPKSAHRGGVRVARMRLGAADESGRQTPEETPGGGFDVTADLVIAALGFDAEDLPALWRAPLLSVAKSGTVAVDKTFATSLLGVYAAGDIVRGASLVVWAIKEGRDAAEAIHSYIQSQVLAPA
jgi:glutamate synthase (NADPH/NADH) small chain